MVSPLDETDKTWTNFVTVSLYPLFMLSFGADAFGIRALPYGLRVRRDCRKKDGMPRKSVGGLHAMPPSVGQGETIVYAEI